MKSVLVTLTQGLILGLGYLAIREVSATEKPAASLKPVPSSSEQGVGYLPIMADLTVDFPYFTEPQEITARVARRVKEALGDMTREWPQVRGKVHVSISS
jgi:hypothetical protein